MNISFFTEGNYRGKIDRANAGRTDTAWISVLGATHYPLFDYSAPKCDLGIVIVPKNFDGNFIYLLTFLRNRCDKIAIMQEGPNDYYQTKSVSYQAGYVDFISKCDIIYCHNEYDRRYFSGLIPDSDVRILPTVALTDGISNITPKHLRNGVMSGGTFCQWYGGIDSYMIAVEFGEDISAPAMGRKTPDEDSIVGIQYLPYMGWSDWMRELSKRKFAVHLMRTFAAGSFFLNCAHLGIPCIGYDIDDTMRDCFPATCVPLGDLERARKVARNLRDNPEFYAHVSAVAIKNANDIYSERQFLDRFFEPFNQEVK